MALVTVESLTFAYSGAARPALDRVSLTVEPGEIVILAGRSGSGKTTLIRAMAGLVPHFHGGRLAGRVEVAGLDTRHTRPAELAGVVATLFQDPEDQVVFGGVEAEVAFGLENAGVAPAEIGARVDAALGAVGAVQLRSRQVGDLSGGELQRVCLASVLALEPALLLLDEPTSQLDGDAAASLIRLVRQLARERGTAVVLSEQRTAGVLDIADRVIELEGGTISAPGAAVTPLSPAARGSDQTAGEMLCRVAGVTFAYDDGPAVLAGASFGVRRGEVVALVGPNGSGKTTLAKVAAGLLDPSSGAVERRGRVAMLTQDPGRFLVRERCDEEVELGARSEEAAAGALAAVGLAGFEGRHPCELSSGERERLALAAVLATEPDLLVLDEPTRGVDPEARRRLAALLRAQAPGRATVLVTHDRELVAAVADRVVEMREGADRVAA